MPIYLTGPHSAGRAMDPGQGRLWGQKRHSLVSLEPCEGPRGSGESRVGRRDWPLHGEGNQHPASFSRTRPRSALSGLHGPGGGEQGLAWPLHAILPQVMGTALSPATGPVPSTAPSPEEAWGPQPSLCPTPDGRRPSLCHQPSPTRLPVCSLPCVRVHVCARLCPLPCRETVPATQSKQVNGLQGHGYATFSVCHDVTAF